MHGAYRKNRLLRMEEWKKGFPGPTRTVLERKRSHQVKLVANSMHESEETNEAGILSSGSRTTRRFESVVESQNGEERG
jgi:hypothetical protein